MILISPEHTREDLVTLIEQLHNLISALKETCEEKDKEIARLNSDRIQPSVSFQERMQRADEEVGRLIRRVRVLEKVISEELYDGECQDEANQMIVDEIHERMIG